MADLQVPFYIECLSPYVPGKPIEETKREFHLKKVIKLASNENPWGPSPKAVQAIRKHLNELHLYPDASGYFLKKELSRNHHLKGLSIILGNGSNEIIDFIIRTFCVEGDAIVTHAYSFIAYEICAQVHGVRALKAPVDQSLLWDPSKIANLVRKDKKARCVFIANPNNPTGTYLPESAIKVLLEKLSKIRDGSTVVVLDCAYQEYVGSKDYGNPLDWMQLYPNLILLRTFSKAYGLAGLRVGYGIARPEIIRFLEKVRQPFNLNSLALVGAAAALRDQTYVKKSVQKNRSEMKFWEKELDNLGIPYWASQANFLLVNSEKGLKKSGPEVFEHGLRNGVIMRPIANYGNPDYLRISIGLPSENQKAVKVLRALKWRT